MYGGRLTAMLAAAGDSRSPAIRCNMDRLCAPRQPGIFSMSCTNGFGGRDVSISMSYRVPTATVGLIRSLLYRALAAQSSGGVINDCSDSATAKKIAGSENRG